MTPPPPSSTLFPYTTLFRSVAQQQTHAIADTLRPRRGGAGRPLVVPVGEAVRSEEHTSELQSHSDLVCRLLLEKKNKNKNSKVASTLYANYPTYDLIRMADP